MSDVEKGKGNSDESTKKRRMLKAGRAVRN